MKNIDKDIKDRNFKRVYLLYGSESYLIIEYRNKLKAAVTGNSPDNMNYAVYNGSNGIDERELYDSLMSFPFLAEYRLVVVEESGMFGKDNDLAEIISQIPDSTVLIMVEKEADKRTKLYKAVQKYGYACEFSTPKPEELETILGNVFKEAGKKLSSHTLSFFVEYVGGDLFHLRTEADKLIDYTCGRAEITQKDIEAICTMQIEKKIFDMVDNLIAHNRSGAMKMYFDLIAMKEAPLGILRFLMSQYNSLLLIRDGMDRNLSDAQIASESKQAPWQVKRNKQRIRDYTRNRLLKCLVLMTNTEEQIKTGNLDEKAGIEILLANLSAI
ncbi:MAG: DNA polymerase III subunit delta [Lachnospiraceae bacterium]|nr:DNA polymerase III subunit delta [Lachnospiraceae bacterium]